MAKEGVLEIASLGLSLWFYEIKGIIPVGFVDCLAGDIRR